MVTRYFANAPAHTIPAGVANNTTTSIVVDSIAGWPTQFPFTAIIEPDTVLEEVVDISNIVGTTLTVTRGVDGSTASAHTAGAVIAHGFIARDAREANTHINATTGVHGATGSLVDTGSLQTITGDKTLSGDTTTNGALFAGGTNTLNGPTTVGSSLIVNGGTNVAGAWTAYGTPATLWTATGTQPAIGNGTCLGRYIQLGKLFIATINIVVGSTTTFGTLNYEFLLPITAQNFSLIGGTATLFDASVPALFPRLPLGVNGTKFAIADMAGARVTATGPIGWATGDKISVLVIGEVA